jgi:D-galactarolactone cycloisomerase
MQIVDVQAFWLSANLDKPFAWSLRWTRTRSSVLVKVTTDEGIVGWGEAGSSGSAAIATVIAHRYRPLVVGRDPFDVEVIWEDLYALTRDEGQKGVAIDAISGIDIALWDVIGKAVGKPVHKLLGGGARPRIVAYATGLYYYDESPDAVAERVVEAEGYVDEGYRAMKMKIGGLAPEDDLAHVRAIREAIGPRIALMVDANHGYNAFTAMRMARYLADQDVLWFEEPVLPEDLDGYQQVKAASIVPIAGGECEYTRFGFKPLLSRRAVDVVQPDLGRAGGLSEGKKIAAIANAFQIQCIPHVWGTGLAQAAALHFMATLPVCPPVRNPQPLWHLPLLEFDRTPNPLRGRITPDFNLEPDGTVVVPTGPGLGVEVDEDAVRHFAHLSAEC